MRGTLPGFRDLYPEDCALRRHIVDIFLDVMGRFLFEEYDGPVLEPLELFTDKSGPEIAGQLFQFEDLGGRKVALRPEMTPTLARMAGSRAPTLRRPIRWCAVGEQFRYERPQKGRLRSFLQLNGDILGEPSFRADGELIGALLSTFAELGLSPDDICLRLSDRKIWGLLLGQFPCDGVAVLRAIDRYGKEPAAVTEERLRTAMGPSAGQFLNDWEQLRACNSLAALRVFSQKFPSPALDERLADWAGLLQFLTDFGLEKYVTVDLSIVRGLAYYTGFVFEVFERSGDGRALAGGGRYDDLTEKLAGIALPACGFAVGDVVLANILRGKGLFSGGQPIPDLWIAMDRDSQSEALAFASEARRAGSRVAYELRGELLIDKQLRQADRSGARFALLPDGSGWLLRNFSTGETFPITAKNFLSLWTKVTESA
ncbi:MAG: ATP phosphoribosyltransferase regulatory subunit [Puniceicoccales bacterium]|jgi:histidyl-tRNA synthetase|nr:ATP phosphoribosyltransferase regulatory subunit [Puniceicoccales bacterium]